MDMPNVAADLTPLYIDLDGTLVASDLLIEAALKFVKTGPLAALQLFRWTLKGKATLKAGLADAVDLDVTRLPYDKEVLALIAQARSQGRRVVLATASHKKVADAVARHLGLFDAVLASDAKVNLSGVAKLRAIEDDAQTRFAYAGNASVDLPIWRSAGSAIVVSSSEGLARRAAAMTPLEAVIKPAGVRSKTIVRSMRLHQWAKNILVFMPAIPVAAQLGWPSYAALCLAFVCFGLCASSAYLLNDLLDIEADRQHPTKSNRPIASGAMPLHLALLLTPCLLVAAFGLALLLHPAFIVVLAMYWVLTLLYSFRIKRVAVLDVLFLAGLYTMRILAGAAVIAIIPSFWILAFSMFMFLSLASAKRYIELADMQRHSKTAMAGRGYGLHDLPLVLAQGVAAGQVSILVFALYINDPTASRHFSSPYPLWAMAPVLLYWICRLWSRAVRGQVNDDPLVFALRDRQSRWIGIACAALLWLAL